MDNNFNYYYFSLVLKFWINPTPYVSVQYSPSLTQTFSCIPTTVYIKKH
jgi:hypothetical protein